MKLDYIHSVFYLKDEDTNNNWKKVQRLSLQGGCPLRKNFKPVGTGGGEDERVGGHGGCYMGEDYRGGVVADAWSRKPAWPFRCRPQKERQQERRSVVKVSSLPNLVNSGDTCKTLGTHGPRAAGYSHTSMSE